MKMQVTFRSGAQIEVDVVKFSTGRNPLTDDLEKLTWTTPNEWTAKLQTVDLSEVVAVVALRETEGSAVMTDVYMAISAERERQDAQWGEQNHPNGTGGVDAYNEAKRARNACQAAAARGEVTWRHILREEIAEAMAETNLVHLRAELIQAAAVCAAWVEAIDRRTG